MGAARSLACHSWGEYVYTVSYCFFPASGCKDELGGRTFIVKPPGVSKSFLLLHSTTAHGSHTFQELQVTPVTLVHDSRTGVSVVRHALQLQ